MTYIKYFLIFLCLSIQITFSQVKKGEFIESLNKNQQTGWSVSMPSKNTIAVGTLNNKNKSSFGYVSIYEWAGSNWKLKGNIIKSNSSKDGIGWSVSMPDDNTIAIGIPFTNDKGKSLGKLKIYQWDGNSWIQKGLDINGDDLGDYFSYSICMPNENTVAIGAPFNSKFKRSSGLVRIYQWNGTSWEQKGLDFHGDNSGDYMGFSVNMPNENTVAIGAPLNDNNGLNSGLVRIYDWNGTTWIQKGHDIYGEDIDNRSGKSISMPNENTIAIGAPFNSKNGNKSGQVRIYEWNDYSWIQKGLEIDGNNSGDYMGYSVSMPDKNTIAVGAPLNSYNKKSAGLVKIFNWNGNNWIQLSDNLFGKSYNDILGRCVSMPDAQTIAIGAPNYNSNNSVGQVRIYSIYENKIGVLENNFKDVISLYPNPTNDLINIQLGDSYSEIKIKVKNSLGQIVINKEFFKVDSINLNIEGETGIYFVEIISNDKSALLKVIKK